MIYIQILSFVFIGAYVLYLCLNIEKIIKDNNLKWGGLKLFSLVIP